MKICDQICQQHSTFNIFTVMFLLAVILKFEIGDKVNFRSKAKFSFFK